MVQHLMRFCSQSLFLKNHEEAIKIQYHFNVLMFLVLFLFFAWHNV